MVYFHHKFSVITWLRDCTNNYNNTLGHDMFFTLQTICTNWERWLTVRASNECPYWIVRTVAILRSGIICFWHYKLSARIGNGGSPCGRPMNAPTGLCERLQYYARAWYVFYIANYPHELGTAARRAGVQWTPLLDCANACNITLGHDMFLTLQTICTNWERWLTVKLSRPRQCMRCRGRFGFTRGFLKLSYWNQLFLGVLLL